MCVHQILTSVNEFIQTLPYKEVDAYYHRRFLMQNTENFSKDQIKGMKKNKLETIRSIFRITMLLKWMQITFLRAMYNPAYYSNKLLVNKLLVKVLKPRSFTIFFFQK